MNLNPAGLNVHKCITI